MVKVVSGEANCDLYRVLEPYIRKVCKQGASFHMIAGPIISLEDRTGTNAILDLASEGLLKLWISPFRQLSHFRVFGTRFAYVEDYHEALQSERSGQYIDDLLQIAKYHYDFDNLLKTLGMQDYSDSKCLVKARKEQLKGIRTQLGELYDFISGPEFQHLLQNQCRHQLAAARTAF